MGPVAQFLVAVAAIFLIGAIGEIVFAKTFIPDAVWLIATGILLGPILGWVTKAQLNVVAPYFAALTLVIVLFEGGSQIKLEALAKVAPRAGVLALATFIASVLALAAITMAASFVGWLPEAWTWSHGLLVGCILGGPSSIIIMPAMERAKVVPSLANLVGLESAITDAFCVVGTAAIIDVMTHTSSASPAVTLLKSFGLGLLIGLVAGFAWLLFLRLLKNSEHAYAITLAVLLLLSVAINEVGGSAALGILTVAIVLGNAPSITKKFELGEGFELSSDVRGVHSHMAFIIKSLFFTFMGMMLGPPWSLIALGVLLAIVLAAARIPAALLALVKSKLNAPSRQLVMLSLPRGMAAGVLATMPAYAGVALTVDPAAAAKAAAKAAGVEYVAAASEGGGEWVDLPVFVFSCIVATILMFAVGFPLIRKQLPVADAVSDGEAAGGDDPSNVVAVLPAAPQPEGAQVEGAQVEGALEIGAVDASLGTTLPAAYAASPLTQLSPAEPGREPQPQPQPAAQEPTEPAAEESESS